MTIVEFLKARIAEDEGQARKHLADADRHGWGSYPARVLAECQAKRAIIEQVADVDWGGYAVRDTILGYLAAVYADHPDYRQEWRP